MGVGQVWGWGRCGEDVGKVWGRCGEGVGMEQVCGVGQVWGCHTYRGVTKVALHPNDVTIAISHYQDVTMT